MIWVFNKENGKKLLISARTEDEALDIIKASGLELVHGKLKFDRAYSALEVEKFTKI